MKNVLSQLWADDNGVVSLEYLVLATILGLGLIVGVTGVTAALNTEFTELAGAILTLNQSYTSEGFSSCVATKGASGATDTVGTIGLVNDSTSSSVDDNVCN